MPKPKAPDITQPFSNAQAPLSVPLPQNPAMINNLMPRGPGNISPANSIAKGKSFDPRMEAIRRLMMNGGV